MILLLSELEKQSLFDRYSVEIVARKYFAEVRESRKSSHLDSIIKTANNYTHFLQPTRVHKSYENTIINILTHIIMKYYDPEILKFNVVGFYKDIISVNADIYGLMTCFQPFLNTYVSTYQMSISPIFERLLELYHM